MTNCCVEATVRTAYEKGFNVISLKDCTCCGSMEEQKMAFDASLPLFSKPMTSSEFLAELRDGPAGPKMTFAPQNFRTGPEISSNDMVASKTALVCIEYQNEFCSEGGKMHDLVKNCLK